MAHLRNPSAPFHCIHILLSLPIHSASFSHQKLITSPWAIEFSRCHQDQERLAVPAAQLARSSDQSDCGNYRSDVKSLPYHFILWSKMHISNTDTLEKKFFDSIRTFCSTRRWAPFGKLPVLNTSFQGKPGWPTAVEKFVIFCQTSPS